MLGLTGTWVWCGIFPTWARAEVSRAQVIYQRITGVTLAPDDLRRRAWEKLIASGDERTMALEATGDRHFLDVKVRDFAAPYSNVEENPVAPFDDLQALFIGITRDNTDAREILTADYRFQSGGDSSLPSPSLNDNRHYEEMDRNRWSPAERLVRRAPQWDNVEGAAGALTSYGFARAHYSAGTNRRPVKYTLLRFLCRAPEEWRQTGLRDKFVRRDVDRSPNDLPQKYQNECRGCHAGMDALSGAFARFDFVGSEFRILAPRKVVGKMNQNSHVFSFGHKVEDSSWVNLLTTKHNRELGWPSVVEGEGVSEFGAMVANAEAFSSCLAERVARHVCRLEKPSRNMKVELAASFRRAGFQLRQLFAEAAIHPGCGEEK
jgi:hypothetical protein